MRSITRSSIRSASCIGALVLASGSWFSAGIASAEESGGPVSGGPSAVETVPAPSPAPEPSKIGPAPSASAEPTSEPTTSAEPTSEPTSSKPAESGKPTPSLVEGEFWWLLPEGANPDRAWEYTQTRIPVNSEIPCGRHVQADLYRGTEEQLASLGDTLEPGEDSAIIVDWTILSGGECESTPQPSAPVETPKPSTPVETPKPSEPAETPQECVTPKPGTPVTEEMPECPGDLPLPNTPAPSTPAAPRPSTPAAPSPSAQAPQETTPVELPMPQTQEQVETVRPTGLPHTGDQGGAVLPLAAGAGICSVVFASTFLGRKND